MMWLITVILRLEYRLPLSDRLKTAVNSVFMLGIAVDLGRTP
jgi:hypothetical protein